MPNHRNYKVGDKYTTPRSKETGVIEEIVVIDKYTVKVKLNIDGKTRWTTWKAE